mmetsp:Transcript_35990/g.66343  ORF Transcript_35990/g.66343 Transcript_35990/m.66343 type:complete len:355 (-) Transcript_35990:637-1701(-)|eukprot:CAMPEP_0197432808 /NCGR_PEP_ID=MMETSP1175-20131217/803_1 /TAXON_ID=1003142 /ORGANISM="Triceratium dubium, Strain CCMP147" /LENGTH=354 /DNA_ID=CAMNT_0042960981 /DNA_START=405 /DNA_END=1469 /DNA_ORIENTATION=-
MSNVESAFEVTLDDYFTSMLETAGAHRGSKQASPRGRFCLQDARHRSSLFSFSSTTDASTNEKIEVHCSTSRRADPGPSAGGGTIKDNAVDRENHPEVSRTVSSAASSMSFGGSLDNVNVNRLSRKLLRTLLRRSARSPDRANRSSPDKPKVSDRGAAMNYSHEDHFIPKKTADKQPDKSSKSSLVSQFKSFFDVNAGKTWEKTDTLCISETISTASISDEDYEDGYSDASTSSPLMSQFRTLVDFKAGGTWDMTDTLCRSETISTTSLRNEEHEGVESLLGREEDNSTQLSILGTSLSNEEMIFSSRVLTPPVMEALRRHLPYAVQDNSFWLKYSSTRDVSIVAFSARHVLQV